MKTLTPGDTVVLLGLPAGFVDDLPPEDQAVIAAMLGKPILFLGYDEGGRAEVELSEPRSDGLDSRTLWVDPSFVRLVE